MRVTHVNLIVSAVQAQTDLKGLLCNSTQWKCNLNSVDLMFTAINHTIQWSINI